MFSKCNNTSKSCQKNCEIDEIFGKFLIFRLWAHKYLVLSSNKPTLKEWKNPIIFITHTFLLLAPRARNFLDRYDSKLEQLKESWMSTITIFHTEKIRDIILKESTTYYYIFLYFWVKWSQFLELTVLILRGKEVPLSC